MWSLFVAFVICETIFVFVVACHCLECLVFLVFILTPCDALFVCGGAWLFQVLQVVSIMHGCFVLYSIGRCFLILCWLGVWLDCVVDVVSFYGDMSLF